MVYKLSLAAADLLVGVFVYPTFAYTLYATRVGPLVKRTLDEGEVRSNSSFNSTLFEAYGVPDPLAKDYYIQSLSIPYRNAFGLFTAVSLMVSMSTLMFASYDRFRAISAPMTYDKTQATKIAKRVTVALWLVAFILGALPTLVSELGGYGIVAGGILIAVREDVSLIMHGIALGVPFVVVWILTVSVNVIVKRQARYRRKLMSNRQNQDSKTERRLTKTLLIMVGVFTACILPALIFVLIPEFVPSVNSENVRVLAREPARIFITLELAVVIILASNSLWNCFIYSFRNKEFRKDAASLHLKILSALGLVRVKEAVADCLYKTAHDGRRRLSSVFTATTGITDLRKRSSTPSLRTESSAATTSIYQASTSKTKGISSTSAPSSSGLDSYM